MNEKLVESKSWYILRNKNIFNPFESKPKVINWQSGIAGKEEEVEAKEKQEDGTQRFEPAGWSTGASQQQSVWSLHACGGLCWHECCFRSSPYPQALPRFSPFFCHCLPRPLSPFFPLRPHPQKTCISPLSLYLSLHMHLVLLFFFLILHLVLLFYFNFKASLLTSLLLLLHSFMPFFINFRNWVSVVLIKMFDLCCFCLRVLVLLLFLFKCLVGFMLVLLYCSSFWNCYSCCWMIY